MSTHGDSIELQPPAVIRRADGETADVSPDAPCFQAGRRNGSVDAILAASASDSNVDCGAVTGLNQIFEDEREPPGVGPDLPSSTESRSILDHNRTPPQPSGSPQNSDVPPLYARIASFANRICITTLAFVGTLCAVLQVKLAQQAIELAQRADELARQAMPSTITSHAHPSRAFPSQESGKSALDHVRESCSRAKQSIVRRVNEVKELWFGSGWMVFALWYGAVFSGYTVVNSFQTMTISLIVDLMK